MKLVRYLFLFPILVLLPVAVFSPGQAASGTPSLESMLPKKLPNGWALVEGPRVHDKKTLFKRIDGQAELYFKYGFEKSVFGVYRNSKKPGKEIEVDLYDMGNPLQAFGIFSRFRTENRPGGVGFDSYMEEQTFFFCQGRYFVMLYGEVDSPGLKHVASAISSKLPGSSAPPRELSLFPEEGLKAGSIQYTTEGLLGHRFLKRGFLAAYPRDGRTARLFLAVFDNIDEARTGLDAYRDYLSGKGRAGSEFLSSLGGEVLKGEDPYHGNVIVFQKGLYLLGVSGFNSVEEGIALLSEILKKM